MNDGPRLPTFLVIGAARSGSSSLHDSLRQHPQVFVSPIKEPHFFSNENKEPPRGVPGAPRSTRVTDINRYMELFEGAKPGMAVGEASVSYLYSEDAPDRIRHYVPDVRLVAILRNPVERAYSAFQYLRERGTEPYADFSEALEADTGWSAQIPLDRGLEETARWYREAGWL